MVWFCHKIAFGNVENEWPRCCWGKNCGKKHKRAYVELRSKGVYKITLSCKLFSFFLTAFHAWLFPKLREQFVSDRCRLYDRSASSCRIVTAFDTTTKRRENPPRRTWSPLRPKKLSQVVNHVDWREERKTNVKSSTGPGSGMVPSVSCIIFHYHVTDRLSYNPDGA